MHKTVISYAYFETENSIYNFDFFIRTGIVDDCLFVIVINEHRCSVEIPNKENIIIIRRDNVGYDFGAHGATIKYLLNKYNGELSFEYFIFMNCSVIGPFLPSYHTGNWTNIFTSKITDTVKLVGTSIVSLEYGRRRSLDLISGPNVEGFCFCLDKIGFEIVYQKGTVFVDHKTKDDAIRNGEFGLSQPIFAAGYSIDCLLYRYQDVNWRNENECVKYDNDNKFPSRDGRHDGISIHPFEVVFHKWFWHRENQVNFEYVDKYRQWKLLSHHKNDRLFIQDSRKITVTKKFSELFLKGNILEIQKGIYCDVYIYGEHYSVNGDGCSLLIDNIYNLTAFWGNDDRKIDATHRFINQFVKDGVIIIPPNYSFNTFFNNLYYFRNPKLFVNVMDKAFVFEKNNAEFIMFL